MLYESWPSLFLEVLFTFILRIGFVLAQIGCVPASSVNLLIMQHLVNMAVSTISFLFVGYPVTIGEGNLLTEVSKILNGLIDIDNFIFNWKIIMVSEAIISTAIAGKAHMAGSIFISMFSSACIQPTIMYFLWKNLSFLNHSSENILFTSYGSTVVMHVFPGAFCLGCIFLYGKRIMRISDIDLCSIAFDSHSTTVIGYAFIISSMMIQPALIAKKNVVTIMMNNILATSIGVTVTTLLNTLFRPNANYYNYWQVVWAFQGALSALLIISSGLDTLKPYQTLMISPIGSLLHFIYSKVILCTIFEDYCNLVAIHCICASIGSYLTCIEFNIKPQEETIWEKLVQRSVFTTIIFVSGFLIAVVIQLLLKYTNLIRNYTERNIYMKAPKVNKKKCPFILSNKNKQLIEPQVHIILTLKSQLFTEKKNPL